jgi:hypothetical protein
VAQESAPWHRERSLARPQLKNHHKPLISQDLAVESTGVPGATIARMNRAATSSHHRRLPLSNSQVLLGLVLGLLGFATWAASSSAEDTVASRFSQACSALDAGDLEGAAWRLRALREKNPELPEARLLESLVAVRRERPALGWHEAFVHAWNHVGRPDLSDSPLLREAFLYLPPVPEHEPRVAASEQEPLLALALEPNATRGRHILGHLRELDPPELIFAADYFLDHESFPSALRTQASQALRTRLSELTVSSPRSMQYPALLLLDGTSPEAPFTPEELHAIEAIATLPDWRETDFHVLYERSLSRFRAAGHAQPTQAAYSVAVSALATRPPFLLFKRTEASRQVLSPEQLRRLGEALWSIGSRMAEESTLLERMLATRMMADGAQLVGDEARARQASALREEARAAAEAMRRAVPERWPLRALNTAHVDAMMRDELACMFRFLPPKSDSNGAP